MKLYGTITSERATKGQGGNKYINIELRSGDRENSIIDYYLIFTLDGLIVQADGGILLDTTNSEGKNAKKQKDEKLCSNGYQMPCDICPKDGQGNCTT